MQPIISPESIRVLSASPQYNYKTSEATYSEPKTKPSLWSRFKAKVKDIWETFQPIVEGVTSFLQATVAVVKTFDVIIQRRKSYAQVAV